MFAGRPPSPSTRLGKGKGIGGPAKGAGSKVPFAADDQYRGAYNHASIASKAEREERLLNHLENLALTAARESDQITAAVAAMNRLGGMPVQKNINENTNVRTVIRAPAKPADAREWMQQHQPKTKTLNS